MRIDKFLKVSRIIKRRTLAAEACEAGRVKINDKVAKPGSTLKVGDQIEIIFGDKNVKVEVKMIKEHVTKEQVYELYEIV